MPESILTNFQYSRLQHRYINETGVIPTIFSGSTAEFSEEDCMVLNQFRSTDILNCEFCINTVDKKVWYRADNEIIELQTSTGISFDTYTSGATLSGETIVFQRNDDTYYNVDLSPLFLWKTSTGTNSIVSKTGGNSADGDYSFAQGYGNQADGDYCFVNGVNNIVSSTYSFCSGVANTVNAIRSTTFGYANTVNSGATDSTTTGYGNTVNAEYSFVNGRWNTINKGDSTVFGAYNTANGISNTISGYYNVGSTVYEHILGRFNEIYTGTTASTTDWIGTDPIFTIGDGISTSRSNCFQILKNGNVTTSGSISATTFYGDGSNLYGLVTTKIKNTYTLSAEGGDFTDFTTAIAFLNGLTGTDGVTLKIDSGNFEIPAAVEINSTRPISIIGNGVNVTYLLGAATDIQDLISILSQCDIQDLTIDNQTYTSNNALFVHPNVAHYIELKNINILNSAIGITFMEGSLFVHNFIIENCNYGISVDGALFNKLDVEVGDITNCGIGILLNQGDASIFDITNVIFSPGAGNVGIDYIPASYNYSDHPSITGCKWDNTGTFFTGFDFTRNDGRDANIAIFSNVGSEDKIPHFYMNVTGNTVAQTITLNTWTLMNFSGSTIYNCKFGVNNNRIIYLPTNKRDLMMWGSGCLQTTTQQANIRLVVAKNGTPGNYGAVTVTLDTNGKDFTWSANAYIPDVAHDDFFEIYGYTTGTEAILFKEFNWLVKAM